jgi:hypothetical protein
VPWPSEREALAALETLVISNSLLQEFERRIGEFNVFEAIGDHDFDAVEEEGQKIRVEGLRADHPREQGRCRGAA